MSLNGILVVNKEPGYTSHDVVAKVKKILGEKVGHTGTLDPNATGVLPLLIGKGTGLAKYLVNHDKTYIATLKLGEKTDTGDLEGNIIEKQDVKDISRGKLEEVLHSFLGKQEQIPPKYSAIKVNGKKLYEYARKGETIELKARPIEIYDIKLIDINNLEIIFEVACSKGTYIRSLCENIAEKLGTVGYMKALKRTVVGEFNIENSVKINEIDEKQIISIEKFLKDKENIILEQNKLELFLNGGRIKVKLADEVYRVYNVNGEFIGSGVVENWLLKRDIIL
ncbi:MAG: tRNA pseudouridine(55) synthase TruB [Clostridia bacterium]|nr:tRNA pseudouridine(55) synthase TruB [Clostridia bacterium]